VLWPDGSDTVFACGGDGTIHDVIQGLAGTPVALAILPFGTANALAHDLGIPLRPSAAAQAAVDGRVRRIHLGRIEYEDFNGKSSRRATLPSPPESAWTLTCFTN
jgi:diacylglycerol kinase family enzyme